MVGAGASTAMYRHVTAGCGWLVDYRSPFLFFRRRTERDLDRVPISRPTIEREVEVAVKNTS